MGKSEDESDFLKAFSIPQFLNPTIPHLFIRLTTHGIFSSEIIYPLKLSFLHFVIYN